MRGIGDGYIYNGDAMMVLGEVYNGASEASDCLQIESYYIIWVCMSSACYLENREYFNTDTGAITARRNYEKVR